MFPRGTTFPILAACLFVAGCVSLVLGQDANWDLANYHLYNPFALTESRFHDDVNAVGIQTSFNPLLDLPYYYLFTYLYPAHREVLVFLAGFPAGILLFLVIAVSRAVLDGFHIGPWTATAFAVLFGISGTIFIDAIGTTYGDIVAAIPIVAGLLTLVVSLRDRPSPHPASALAAGMLFGGAAGLKLTAAIFAPAVFIALLLVSAALKRGAAACVVFSAGWIVAFLSVYGWWGTKLAADFGNPIFPYLNNVFLSDWEPAVASMDTRYLPHGLLQELFYPCYWLPFPWDRAPPIGLRDGHFALAYAGILSIGAHALRSKLRLTDVKGRLHALICLFFSLSFVIWEGLFSTPRYAVALEVLSGIVVVVAVATLLPARFQKPRIVVSVLAVLLVATVATERPIGSERLVHTGPTPLVDVPASLPDDSLVVVADKPLGFVLPFLGGRHLSFVGIVELPPPGYRLRNAVMQRIDEDRPVAILINKAVPRYEAQLATFGLRILPESCRSLTNALERAATLCSAERIAAIGVKFISRLDLIASVTAPPADDDAFVSEAYRKILGREADSAGREYWLGELKNKAIGRPGLVEAFAASPENVNRMAMTTGGWLVYGR